MVKKKRSTNPYVTAVVLLAAIVSYFVPQCGNRTTNTANEATHTTEATTETIIETTANAAPVVSLQGLELPAPNANKPEKILHHKGYTVSYNAETLIPNWVAWELTPARLVENVTRSNKFLPDPLLDSNEAVCTSDYTHATDRHGNKLDRGHMCPAADNKWDEQAMQESFYMTNICPQHHNLNRGDWQELEQLCREWAKRYGKIYVVCGPILYRQTHHTLTQNRPVVVPEAFFKCVLVMGERPQAIGFVFKNTQCNNRMSYYVNTVDEVERITGYDLFASLPDDLEAEIESQYNLNNWIHIQ